MLNAYLGYHRFIQFVSLRYKNILPMYNKDKSTEMSKKWGVLVKWSSKGKNNFPQKWISSISSTGE